MKEVFSALSDRIKTPYYGYALLAFLAFNWRAIFYLLLTKGTPHERLIAFDLHSSFMTLIIIPLVFGLIISLANPWLKVIFTFIEKKPRQIFTDSISDEEHNRLKYQIKLKLERNRLEEIEEESLISRAKRDTEIDSIEDPQVKEKLKDDVSSVRESSFPYYKFNERESHYGEYETKLISMLKHNKTGTIIDDQEDKITIGNDTIGTGEHGERDYIKSKDALRVLKSLDLLSSQVTEDGSIYKLTSLGWDEIESYKG